MPTVETISNIFLALSIITILSGIVFAATKSSSYGKQNKNIGVENIDQKALQSTNRPESNLQPSVKRISYNALFLVGLLFTVVGITLKINP